MSNIFNIKQELLDIFNELEENEGEITPELEEQLSIKQEELNSKIKSYSNVIKMLESDISAIKEEKARLDYLKTSKEKTINRIKKIIIDAIELFGDTTKSGGKFIDYGTGKVSVKNTQAVEVDEDSINRFVNRFITGIKWYSENNQLQVGLVKTEDLLEFANSKTPFEIENDVEIDKLDINDISNLKANIDLDIDFKNLISTEKGINFLHALLNYDTFGIKAKVNKKAIKDEAKGENQFVPVYATIVNNKSITIK